MGSERSFNSILQDVNAWLKRMKRNVTEWLLNMPRTNNDCNNIMLVTTAIRTDYAVVSISQKNLEVLVVFE
jgi:hypothetical protein